MSKPDPEKLVAMLTAHQIILTRMFCTEPVAPPDVMLKELRKRTDIPADVWPHIESVLEGAIRVRAMAHPE